jgi:hypothetical protein
MKYSAPLVKFFAYLFLMMFLVFVGSGPVIAADVCDRKPELPKCNLPPDPPPDPPPEPDPDPDDPCADFAAPDFVFWRDSHTNLVAQVSIFAAESDTGCEAKLLDVPLPEGSVNDLKLTYSSGISDGEFMGRVVWADHRYGEPQSVWMFDFSTSAGQVVPNAGMPVNIMNNDVAGVGWNIEDLDLSPDMQSLVYRVNDYRDEEPDYFRIFSQDIEDCLLSACPFSDGDELYSIQELPETSEALDSPVWGPLGQRIYFIERTGDTYLVKLIEANETQATTLFTYNGGEHIFDVASGITGSGEVLALEIGTDPYIHGCRGVYTLNVTACEEGSACELDWAFAGIWPSWTKDAKLIHTYQGTRVKRQCKTDTIGVWDNTGLKALMKGYEPEAAGG